MSHQQKGIAGKCPLAKQASANLRTQRVPVELLSRQPRCGQRHVTASAEGDCQADCRVPQVCLHPAGNFASAPPARYVLAAMPVSWVLEPRQLKWFCAEQTASGWTALYNQQARGRMQSTMPIHAACYLGAT